MTEQDKEKLEALLIQKCSGAIVDILLGSLALLVVVWAGGPFWGALATGFIIFVVSGIPDRVREEMNGEEVVKVYLDLRRERKREERAQEQVALRHEVLDRLPEGRSWVFTDDLALQIFGDDTRHADLLVVLAGLEHDGLMESRWDPEREGSPLRRRQYRRKP